MAYIYTCIHLNDFLFFIMDTLFIDPIVTTISHLIKRNKHLVLENWRRSLQRSKNLLKQSTLLNWHFEGTLPTDFWVFNCPGWQMHPNQSKLSAQTGWRPNYIYWTVQWTHLIQSSWEYRPSVNIHVPPMVLETTYGSPSLQWIATWVLTL